MSSVVKLIDNFHDTRVGKLIFGFAEIGLGTTFAIIAVDTGYIWQHLLALVLFVGGLRNLVNAFHHTKPKHAKKSKG